MVKAQYLPPELVEHVVSRLALSVSSSNSVESPNPLRVHALLFVCTAWHEPVLRVLQRFVRLTSARQAVQFVEMLLRDERARHRLIRLE